MHLHTKMTRFLSLVLIMIMLVSTGTASFAETGRYDQNGSFESSGSPLLNPNYTSDQWNKWEAVAWGVFLSNFVVPMADSYETAFSSSTTEGSRGSGLKALSFSAGGDTGAATILRNYTQFAIDSALQSKKELSVSYYYLDQAGNVLIADPDGNAIKIDPAKDPTKHDVQPEAVSLANFTNILPLNLADLTNTVGDGDVIGNNTAAWIAGTKFDSDKFDDVFGVSGAVYRPSEGPYGNVAEWPDAIALPPTKNATYSHSQNAILGTQFPKRYYGDGGGPAKVVDIAVAKLPIIWLKASDGSYVKVWDMLDPWDFQIATTMLAKEINSDSAIDTGAVTTQIWEIVAKNIDTAYTTKAPLTMDCYGNIVAQVGGKPLVVIPAAYNKHITTVPTVNLVNSFFLTGPTSGVSGNKLVQKGKMPVKKGLWWLSNDNESDEDGVSKFGVGTPALGWKGSGLPNNAVALFFDSDMLAYSLYKDRVAAKDNAKFYDTPLKYYGKDIYPHVTTVLGVADLSLDGNRQYKRGNVTSYVVPKLELAGISKAAGLGAKDGSTYTSKGAGVKALLTMLNLQSSIVGLLPASYNEADTKYVDDMVWQNVESPLLDTPVMVPVVSASGTNGSKVGWTSLARDFVNFYGTKFYPNNKERALSEIAEAMKASSTATYINGAGAFDKLAKALQYTADGSNMYPSAAASQHARTPNMIPFLIGGQFANKGDSGDLIWQSDKYVKKDVVELSWFNLSKEEDRVSLTQRWIKAYPTNKALENVATYLGMRGDTEFSGAAANYVYLTYLNIYGVGSVDGKSGVSVSTLNDNPTNFNEKIYDAKSSPLFKFNPTEGTKTISDADKAREINNYAYELLSPTSGHEYKRQLMSNVVGNFMYDQYTKTVYGGSLEYNSGGVQQVVTRSQTGFLRFPSLDDNVFTRWFYQEYATVALMLMALGMVFIVVFGILRNRKVTWFIISTILLVTSVVVIPFVNDLASVSMDGLVSGILRDKTTLWSMSEMIADSNMQQDFLAQDGMDSEEAQIASDITKSMSIAYTDRTLVLKQDISHKVLSLGNFAAYQQFSSTRWMLPSIIRQFTADDGSAAYLYVPLLDAADDAANAYWWYNPKDAIYSEGGLASSDAQARYAVGTQNGIASAEYPASNIKEFYPEYHSTLRDNTAPYANSALNGTLSYRSLSQSVVGSIADMAPIHDYIYMYMNNAYTGTPDTATWQTPLLPLKVRPILTADNAVHEKYWGDLGAIDATSASGGVGTYTASLYNYGASLPSPKDSLWHGVSDTTTTTAPPKQLDYLAANQELFQTAQRYVRDQRDTMYGEFAYLWSTETQYPYFYALVKDTMSAMGQYDYPSGKLDATKLNTWDTSEGRLGVVLNALTGTQKQAGSATTDVSKFYGTTRSNFMYQSGLDATDIQLFTQAQLPLNISTASGQMVFTGYIRDILDLESMFYNMIPYMYQMTLTTGGLVGEDSNDKGLFGKKIISETQYRTYKGLPESWLYRSNWATKIVEAPAYNKAESIGYYDTAGVKQSGTVTMTYFPEAYELVGRKMIFSEAQLMMSGLNENDLTTLELKLIKLNNEAAKKWTTLINYVNSNGMTAEVMCRQMALDAMLLFNESVTPKGLGNAAFSLIPSGVDLRSLSFDTIMRVVLLNTSKDTSFFGADAMATTVAEFGMFTGTLLLATAWVCVYGVTIMRAFLLAFIFIAGVFGVARGVFASNASKRATLQGYLSNIGILFGISFVYYQVFNVLMMGASSTEYVNTGLRGSSAPPTVALFVIFVASCVYTWLMWRMFRVALGSVISGSHDLGYGVYKDKASSGMSKITKGINNLRSSHSFEDGSLGHSRAEAGSFVSGVEGESAHAASGGRQSRRRDVGGPATSGTGSGTRALDGGMSSRGPRSKTALDDHESVDSVISRGGSSSSPSNPAMNLDDYLGTPK